MAVPKVKFGAHGVPGSILRYRISTLSTLLSTEHLLALLTYYNMFSTNIGRTKNRSARFHETRTWNHPATCRDSEPAHHAADHEFYCMFLGASSYGDDVMAPKRMPSPPHHSPQINSCPSITKVRKAKYSKILAPSHRRGCAGLARWLNFRSDPPNVRADLDEPPKEVRNFKRGLSLINRRFQTKHSRRSCRPTKDTRSNLPRFVPEYLFQPCDDCPNLGNPWQLTLLGYLFALAGPTRALAQLAQAIY